MSASAVVKIAKQLLGIKYTWGGADPSTGFDCVGLVHYCFKKAAGINLPFRCIELLGKGTPVSRENLKAGDLIFPNDNHVGICISNSEYIHVSQGNAVRISPIIKFYMGRRIL